MTGLVLADRILIEQVFTLEFENGSVLRVVGVDAYPPGPHMSPSIPGGPVTWP